MYLLRSLQNTKTLEITINFASVDVYEWQLFIIGCFQIQKPVCSFFAFQCHFYFPFIKLIRSDPSIDFNGHSMCKVPVCGLVITGSPPVKAVSFLSSMNFSLSPASCCGVLHRKPSTKGSVKNLHSFDVVGSVS